MNRSINPDDAGSKDIPQPAARNAGPGRLLVAVYAIFALAASARAAFQILTKFDHAPLAYLLSAFAAAVYVVATVGLARSGATAYRISVAAVGVEMAGVLAVGIFGLVDPAALPDDTVWSGFGSGYGYVPLILPMVGLWWLYRHRADARR
ncbi:MULTISPECIES: hypothetical protein [unclassified Arthrobacter]|uniref:hypothetical protein n=1 Tax=unclassified Arthrobacter TaxID=235627 RepID=UPI001E4636AF|nr:MULTISPECIES: hypothetical protein [unclassified Arthrobacter]MCC9146269.1 hypothetical protein [Arthrobacter sp. zg-Y919]MDK1277499.1 hypothetical protein [Arthrobacter sp. zg.Y919]MDM7990361.1 hypothetical protein [Arthrobacter sp. zg-Y877]WIB03986.1 hypothetical protein QNO10_04805 [Arthrobacter sp. zg-Y919]